jgi:hypothetical protein
MNKKTDDGDFEEIGRLIQDDVDEALRVFRSGDFGKRLRARIAADERAVKAKSFLRRIAVPSATLLAVSAALFLLNVHRSPAPCPVYPRLFVAVLSQLPAFSRSAAEFPSGPAGMAGMSEAGGGFQSALASAERRKREGEREPTFRPDGMRVPVLSLKKKMEILYKDKVIERALVLLIGKSKEV